MTERGPGGVVLLDKTIDNSRVVREHDPRSHRELWTVLTLVALVVAGLVLYAWPHYASLQTGMAAEQLQREKERLREDNRKLRLEKAALESLNRVEHIAERKLGLEKPKPEQVVVVERRPAGSKESRIARGNDPKTRDE